jgi:molecular chaperone DnaK
MDLGTSRSSVGTIINGNVEVLRLPGGAWDMPSIVGFRRNGTVMLGESARTLRATDPENVIASPKRILGRRYHDPAIRPYLDSLAMPVYPGPNDEIILKARGQEFTPTEACAHIMYLLALVAKNRLRREITEVLLSTPVSFGEVQYNALSEAAQLAGMSVIGFVDEPAAAVLSNVDDEGFKGLVAVYDFGGGTFDFAVTEVSQGTLKVIATAGDGWLGGDDMDEAIAGAAANAFWAEHRIELRNLSQQWQRLLAAAEKAKLQLTTQSQAVLTVNDVANTSKGRLDLVFPITREQFSLLIQDIIKRSLQTCAEALAVNGLKVKDLNTIYLSGGSSYVPAVRQAVAAYFGKEPRTTVPSERAVLVGLILHGAGIGWKA